MRAPCSLVSILLVALLLPATASAQDIPDDIPDSPSPRELDERREKWLKERHHATLSRLFASTKMAVAPLPGVLGYGVQVAGGVQLERGGAILWATDIYQIPVKTGTSNRVLPKGDVEAFFATSLQLQLSLRRLLAPSKLANRSALALGMGWSGGTAGNGGMSLSVTPEYILPVNSYWSLPIGFSLNTIVNSAPEARRTFLGLHVGVRTHFGQRRQLK